MATPEVRPVGTLAPVASVWCRQVDNEAESPGYTTIPDDFAGRRETLEAIRIVGNLTINVADTHDYWDPDPAQPLSFYPNLFLYPAANGRYTCIGRMFLSTEDRPRLGMKTLVFESSELHASGDFGGAILRAHSTMGAKPTVSRPAADVDPNVLQAVGEGFLFHRGTTEPVVLVASDQWDAAAKTVLDLVASLPSSLVSLGAFLVFPYFLPAAKVNLHEFTEQIPLALAVMRVPKGEAQGERHAKRIQSWEAAPVAFRDLTKPWVPKGKETVPLILQYSRDHADEKLAEVARRVDLVEGNRIRQHLQDADRQGGRDRRKEMWRIATAMETAALLQSRPKGRSVPMSGEAAKRASEYLKARPAEATPVHEVPAAPAPSPAVPSVATQLPAWLQRPPDVVEPTSPTPGVPVSTSDDPSLRPAAPPPPPSPVAGPVAAGPAIPDAELESRLRPVIDRRFEELAKASPIPTTDAAVMDARLGAIAKELEAKWSLAIETRAREASDSASRALLALRDDLTSRLVAVEVRPSSSPDVVADEVTKRLRSWVDQRLGDLETRASTLPKTVAESVTAQLKTELEPRIAAVEARPVLSAEEMVAEAAQQVEETLGPRVTAIESRPTPSPDELAASAADKIQGAIEPRLTAIERRPVFTADSVVEETVKRVRASVDAHLAVVDEKVRSSVQTVAEAWAERLREELKRSADELGAHSAKAEEELRTALVAQIDLEVRELKEQGTALREEVEERVREILQARNQETEQRRSKEVRELEQRLNLLVEGRSKDLEQRLTQALTEQRTQVGTIANERLADVERRLGVEREARAAELTESQAQAIAGLQVRLQSYFEQKLRENQEREREKYVELLARLKSEVDQSLARTIDSTRFDSAVRERVLQVLDASRPEQEKAYQTVLADAEVRLRTQVDEDAARLERTVRAEVSDLDRRVEVLTDRMLPLLRQTWLKVAELEKSRGEVPETEARVKELRRELARELRRLEGEMIEQTADLRERLETAIASQGRIWLNLLRQLSQEGEAVVPHSPSRLRRPSAKPLPEEELLDSDFRAVTGVGAFTEDPPNPMDPEPALAPEEREPRRRPRRS